MLNMKGSVQSEPFRLRERTLEIMAVVGTLEIMAVLLKCLEIMLKYIRAYATDKLFIHRERIVILIKKLALAIDKQALAILDPINLAPSQYPDSLGLDGKSLAGKMDGQWERNALLLGRKIGLKKWARASRFIRHTVVFLRKGLIKSIKRRMG